MKDRDIWRLPGPSRFLDKVEASILARRNVHLSLPSHVPSELADAVEDASSSRVALSRVVLGSDGRPKADDSPFLFGATPGELGSHGAFAGSIMWVETPDGVAPSPTFVEAAIAFDRATSGVPAQDRPMMCLITRGIAWKMPTTATWWEEEWKGNVNLLDMLTFANTILPKQVPLREANETASNMAAPTTSMLRQLAALMIAQVAMWDFDVARRLAREPLVKILEPRPILHSMAARRRWTAEQVRFLLDGGAPNTLSPFGIVDTFEGADRIHSALLTYASSTSRLGFELEGRIWNAEMAAIMPFIDDQRRRILSHSGSNRGAWNWKVPWGHGRRINLETWEYSVENVHRLEIGHIQAQMRGTPARFPHCKDETTRMVDALKGYRDRLSHLHRIGHDVLTFEHITDLSAPLPKR